MVCQEYCIILLCTAQVAEGLRGTPLQVHISGGCSSTRYTPQSWFERLGTETQDFGQLWSLKSLKISNAKQKLWFSQISLGFLHSALTIWFWSKNISKNSSPWHNGWVHRALVRQRHIASRPGSARREVFVVSLSHCVSFASRLHPHGSPNEGETHSLCLEGVLSSRTWQKSSWNFQLGKESERNLRRKWASLFFLQRIWDYFTMGLLTISITLGTAWPHDPNPASSLYLEIRRFETFEFLNFQWNLIVHVVQVPGDRCVRSSGLIPPAPGKLASPSRHVL